MNKWILFLAAVIVLAVPAIAQYGSFYGTGVIWETKYAAPGTLKLTMADTTFWKTVPAIDVTEHWDGAWSGHPNADETVLAKVAWANDTVYVFVTVDDFEPFYWGQRGTVNEPWKGDQILIGVDAKWRDTTAKDNNWSGWPFNAPGKGPVTYKFTRTGATLNWGGPKNAQDSGFVRANMILDTVKYDWTIMAAIYVPGARANKRIGFNIGGSQANAATAAADTQSHEGGYAWYSWGAVDYPGGDVMYNVKSFGTLELVNAPEYYGTNVFVDVAKAQTTPKLTLADTTIWKNVPAIDPTYHWDGAWSGHPNADETVLAKLLWAPDTLYVFVTVDDFEPFYWGQRGTVNEPWKGDQILIGVDAKHMDTTAKDNNWSGWPFNAPGKGPVTYKFTRTGATLNWGGPKNAQDSGFVRCNMILDTVKYDWTIMAAIYVPGLNLGKKIGFNIGGSQANAATAAADTQSHEGGYAWYSWGAVDYPGGDVMYNVKSFGTLLINNTLDVKQLAGNVIPSSYQLSQNYPNPFNPSTAIRYAIPHSGLVTLTVFNVLGQEVARLVDGVQSAGTYQATWNAHAMGSGMYFYQLKVDGQPVETRKMVLMK